MAADPAPRTVRLPDGRQLEVLVDGPPAGRALVFHHGTPFAAVAFPPLFEAAARHGLRTVLYSRPGYATSTPRPSRSVADVAGDVGAILDSIGADDFLAIGWSGGGPHAIACAALLPDRCLAAATIAGVAPYGVDGLDWLAGMGPENIEEFGLAVRGQAALRPWLENGSKALASVTGADIAAAFGGLISEVDRSALTGDFAEYMAAATRRSVSSGISGWLDDDLAFVRHWGFELSKIAVPIAIWQGEQDRMVPFSHGKWLAAHIPGAESRLFADQGHLSLAVSSLDRIIGDLVQTAKG